MKTVTTLIKPPYSESFFRIYAEDPICGSRIFYFDHQNRQEIWDLLCKLSVSPQSASRKEPVQVSDETAKRIEKIICYMDANLKEKINLDMVAKHIGMSKKSLSWFCSRHLPGGFNRFLIAMRLDRAAIYLLSTSDIILRVSLDCGFESLSNFNTQFWKRFEITPSEYRKK